MGLIPEFVTLTNSDSVQSNFFVFGAGDVYRLSCIPQYWNFALLFTYMTSVFKILVNCGRYGASLLKLAGLLWVAPPIWWWLWNSFLAPLQITADTGKGGGIRVFLKIPEKATNYEEREEQLTEDGAVDIRRELVTGRRLKELFIEDDIDEGP